jgi:hypothetical protein
MNKLLLILLLLALPALLAAVQKSQPNLPVALNHFFIVVDHDTYAAMEQSIFLRKEFAYNETRTTVRTDRTYTGLYFYGANTYFEFFDAMTETARKVGDCALAFGVDQPGASKKLQARLQTTAPNLITRGLDGVQHPWFYMLAPRDFPGAPGFTTWTMEYHPEFLAKWRAEVTPDRGVTRRQILRRYAAVLKDQPPRPLLIDVTELTLALSSDVQDALTELCRQYGYSVQNRGEAVWLSGPAFKLQLVRANEASRGVLGLKLRVARKPMKQTEFRFGQSSVLKFQNNQTAVWTF